VNVHTPKVPYKETIRKTASAQGKYKKQTGGTASTATRWLKLEPLKRGAGFQFVDEDRRRGHPTELHSRGRKGSRRGVATKASSEAFPWSTSA